MEKQQKIPTNLLLAFSFPKEYIRRIESLNHYEEAIYSLSAVLDSSEKSRQIEALIIGHVIKTTLDNTQTTFRIIKVTEKALLKGVTEQEAIDKINDIFSSYRSNIIYLKIMKWEEEIYGKRF